MNINQELVKRGWCWLYRRYAPGDIVLDGLKNEAREERNGLQVDPHPMPPWILLQA
jgi:micrococcal nuclease